MKTELPLAEVYAILEPGPVLLLSTAQAGRANLMALSWHCMLDFEPPLVGCGNTHGGAVDKFAAFGLSVVPSTRVAVPRVEELNSGIA